MRDRAGRAWSGWAKAAVWAVESGAAQTRSGVEEMAVDEHVGVDAHGVARIPTAASECQPLVGGVHPGAAGVHLYPTMAGRRGMVWRERAPSCAACPPDPTRRTRPPRLGQPDLERDPSSPPDTGVPFNERRIRDRRCQDKCQVIAALSRNLRKPLHVPNSKERLMAPHPAATRADFTSAIPVRILAPQLLPTRSLVPSGIRTAP